MYFKLAYRNIRRSLRDYIIYFVTLTLTAALMYSFLALGFSPDILAMAENMSILTSGILILSVLVALLSSFVVGYAVRFMLGQRKKEFAAYELMGMEVKTVRNLFLVENGIIGGAAFLLGSLLGTGLSGFLNQVVQNIFEVPHHYQILFSLRAWGMALFFFILMYGFGMLRAAKVIRRRKVIDLLYDSRKNEETGFRPLHRSVLACLLSLAAMVAGVILLGKGLHIQTNEAMLYWGGGLSADPYGGLRDAPENPGFTFTNWQSGTRAESTGKKTCFFWGRSAGVSNLPGGQWLLYQSC